MLLYPLYYTSFCIWDALKEKNWYEAQQIVLLSASSKTSIGLAYALQADAEAPTIVGVTSQPSLEMVRNLGLHAQCLTYDTLAEINTEIPTVIVDMSGNNKVMAALHTRLGDLMRWTIKVGLTHWTKLNAEEGIIENKSDFFLCPLTHTKENQGMGGC